MARKKKNDTTGVVLLIIIMTLIVVALATPVVIIIGYLYNKTKEVEIRKKITGTMADFWLEDNEKRDFKEKAYQLSKVEKIIQQANDNGEESGISRNQDGTFSARSKLGKELKETINKNEAIKSNIVGYLIELQNLPISRWKRFNNYVKNGKSFLLSIFSWITILMYYSITLGKKTISEAIMPYQALATNFLRDKENRIPMVDGDLKMVAIATSAAIVSYFLFRFIFSNAANKYSPKPEIVTLENIDKY